MSPLLIDANVLIDFLNTGNLNVLEEYSQNVAPVEVLDMIVGEIKEIDELSISESGLNLRETEFDILENCLNLANAEPSMSFEDHCVFETARQNQFGIITGERKMIAKAARENIAVIRGFRVIYELCDKQLILKEDGISIVKQIVEYNPYFNDSIRDDFLKLF
ncbi:MAG: hypothetical protein U9Q77_02285 [Candidatus Marinimicrobia bacterium]|nr:hypothetical protein [Candidatus Neomarinimicrobiota bacterium]